MHSASESTSTVRAIPISIMAELKEASGNDQDPASGSNSSDISCTSSPRSIALPSPPDSPAESVSSLPSVTSSFFFSSAAPSPGHLSRPLSDHEHEQDRASNHSHESATRGLIIPSLALPPALRRPTPYGQTLGEVRLLVMGRQGAGKSFLTGLLLEDNEEVVDVASWEDPVGEDGEGDEEMVILGMSGAKVLRASTAWVEHTDGHGLEKFEPAKNVEIVELPGYDSLTDGKSLFENLRSAIHAPFRSIAEVVHPKSQPSSLLANLLSSAATPLFTALILLLPSAPTPLDRLIIDSLGGDIPIIVLSSASSNTTSSVSSSSNHSPVIPSSTSTFISSFARTLNSKLSSFRPFNAVSLKHGLFQSPEVINTLRMEASERFMRWREVELAVSGVLSKRARLAPVQAPPLRTRGLKPSWDRWDKDKWERDWMEDFSKDVSVRLQQARVKRGEHPQLLPPPYLSIDHDLKRLTASPAYSSTSLPGEFERPPSSTSSYQQPHPLLVPHAHQTFDPLHLPSLVLFTVSMLGPLKTRILDAIWGPTYSTHNLTGHQSITNEKLDLGPVVRREEKHSFVRWFVVGGLLSVGFVVGVSVGAAKAAK
ncbi:hypothetical protein FA15DRAFT_663956 [Coprinopsis marcescibilis]|uniref:Septin-type G domain-containing protein n=1 Tax=Coprinopsis marcescibilis TaxID=230819 RepID=A0A5C3L8R7_COPMA|nr:hypothetical protein FA15DRAFT_663956 [Coprinopsis marcescibilis]